MKQRRKKWVRKSCAWIWSSCPERSFCTLFLLSSWGPHVMGCPWDEEGQATECMGSRGPWQGGLEKTGWLMMRIHLARVWSLELGRARLGPVCFLGTFLPDGPVPIPTATQTSGSGPWGLIIFAACFLSLCLLNICIHRNRNADSRKGLVFLWSFLFLSNLETPSRISGIRGSYPSNPSHGWVTWWPIAGQSQCPCAPRLSSMPCQQHVCLNWVSCL